MEKREDWGEVNPKNEGVSYYDSPVWVSMEWEEGMRGAQKKSLTFTLIRVFPLSSRTFLFQKWWMGGTREEWEAGLTVDWMWGVAFSQSLTEGVCVLGGAEGLEEVDIQAAQGGQSEQLWPGGGCCHFFTSEVENWSVVLSNSRDIHCSLIT